MALPLCRLAVSFAALLAAAYLAAQEATNRDQSQYTELRPEGFPIRPGLAVVAASDAKLRDDDLVFGVELAGEARAYPVNLMWEPENEVLNNTLGGKAISATWCPIAHSAAVYDRSLDGRRLDLGAVGLREGVFILTTARPVHGGARSRARRWTDRWPARSSRSMPLRSRPGPRGGASIRRRRCGRTRAFPAGAA